jgi:hypothetical protein
MTAPAPNPVASGFIPVPDHIGTFRNIHCPHYDACLELACQKRWVTFTCRHCAYFKCKGKR